MAHTCDNSSVTHTDPGQHTLSRYAALCRWEASGPGSKVQGLQVAVGPGPLGTRAVFCIFYHKDSMVVGTQILSPIGPCLLLALLLLGRGAIGKSPNPGGLCFLISKSDGTVVSTVTAGRTQHANSAACHCPARQRCSCECWIWLTGLFLNIHHPFNKHWILF